jgi:hypothetical protein
MVSPRAFALRWRINSACLGAILARHLAQWTYRFHVFRFESHLRPQRGHFPTAMDRRCHARCRVFGGVLVLREGALTLGRFCRAKRKV